MNVNECSRGKRFELRTVCRVPSSLSTSPITTEGDKPRDAPRSIAASVWAYGCNTAAIALRARKDVSRAAQIVATASGDTATLNGFGRSCALIPVVDTILWRRIHAHGERGPLLFGVELVHLRQVQIIGALTRGQRPKWTIIYFGK